MRDLPFPYTSKAQFERRMEVPLGMEWNTRKGFQRGTMPRVTKKVRRANWMHKCVSDGMAGLDRNNYRPVGKAVLIAVPRPSPLAPRPSFLVLVPSHPASLSRGRSARYPDLSPFSHPCDVFHPGTRHCTFYPLLPINEFLSCACPCPRPYAGLRRGQKKCNHVRSRLYVYVCMYVYVYGA